MLLVLLGSAFLFLWPVEKSSKDSLVSGRVVNLDINSRKGFGYLALTNRSVVESRNSSFDIWYDRLPVWLETNGFPGCVLNESRSLAVSLRAMYAEKDATPNVVSGGGVSSADGNLSRAVSNIFSRSLSQKYLIDLEVSGRLFGSISSQIQSFDE